MTKTQQSGYAGLTDLRYHLGTKFEQHLSEDKMVNAELLHGQL